MREGWKSLTIGDVAEITDYVANGSFATLRENVSYKNTKDYAILVRLADYSSGFDESKFVYIDKHSYDFLAKSKLFGGEIIMSNVGSLGKLFICPDLGMPMSLAPNSIVIKTDFNRFYYYLFQSRHYQDLILSISSTTALPKFNKTSFKKLPVSVPSVSEQERIVAELDLLSGILDKQRTQLKELDTLARSVFYEMFGNPVDNERGWKVHRVDTIGEVVSGSTPSTTDDSNWDGDVNWITPAEMDVQLFYGETVRKITEKAAKKITLMPVGTVLLSSRAPIGKLAISTVPMCCNQGFKNIICRDTVNNVFLYFYLMLTMDRVQALGRGATFKEVSKQAISAYPVIVPPIALQESFATMIISIEQQKARINRAIAETQNLLDYTMDKYFG